MKFGVLLSGCGVYDGAEIQEAAMAMLAIVEAGHEYQCISIDKEQHHVVNHLTGEEMDEKRNMMIEAARIARGDVKNIGEITPADIDALVIPGGFGSAKNFSKWAFLGPEGEIDDQVKLLIVNMVNVGKPVCALCVSPVVVAKALEGSDISPYLTLGTDQESSPYDIPSFNEGIESVGAVAQMKTVREVLVDTENKIVTAPCYMMDATILDIRNNTKQAIEATLSLI
ncbi:MAG: isoprenoid biosynthesis glyoxalase ElbB [Crocinitomicaceae bacterium]|nr:isoprenoid biosynthesis glyoxalase ElbB [Crocinitomicaceae bacterium]